MVSRRRQTWRDIKRPFQYLYENLRPPLDMGDARYAHYSRLAPTAAELESLERPQPIRPIPPAPYMEEPPMPAPRFGYNLPPEGYGRYSPIDLDLSPIDNVSRPTPTPPSPYAVNIPPPPTVTDITGLPVAAPEAAPAPVAPPAGDIGWPMSDEEIRRAATGIRGAAPTPAAPAPAPEEQWLIDEKKKIAEIRRRASAIAPQYADYGAPIPEAEFLWSETQTPEQATGRREALGQQLATRGWHRFHGIRPPEHFAERRARRREKQLARGAPPTWSERAEHEMKLAGIEAQGKAPSPFGKYPAYLEGATPEEVGQWREQELAPPTEKPVEWDLWQQAQREVLASLGGSAMMGLDEEAQAKYYPQILQRFNELKQQFVPRTGMAAEGLPTETSPYPEYPDAFMENGIWKVMRNGKKYRIEK